MHVDAKKFNYKLKLTDDNDIDNDYNCKIMLAINKNVIRNDN